MSKKKTTSKRRRKSTDKQVKQRTTYRYDGTSTTTLRDKSVGRGIYKPSNSKQHNNKRKSGRVITNNTSNKSFRRGTMKRSEKRLHFMSWLIKPVIVTFKKRNSNNPYKSID